MRLPIGEFDPDGMLGVQGGETCPVLYNTSCIVGQRRSAYQLSDRVTAPVQTPAESAVGR